MRTFIVAGSPEARLPAGIRPGPADRVIAADRGAQHARTWGWPVHLLVGDLDSAPPEDVAALAAAGVPVLRAPTDKDETDLELALMYALAGDAGEIVICAALGGRADHFLANVLLLARPDLAGRGVLIADGAQRICLLRGGETLALHGTAGDLLTLLPLGGDAAGIRTAGLRYPLRDETLPLGAARGVSNVLEGAVATVSLRDGLLLVIHVQATRA